MPSISSARHVAHHGWRGGRLSRQSPGPSAWTSPIVAPGFPATEVVPSWTALTPPGTWIEVRLRVRPDGPGPWSPWLELGRWASDLPAEGGALARASVPGQHGEWGRVAVDVVHAAADRGFAACQLRIVGHGDPAPTLTHAGLVASAGDPLAGLDPHWRPRAAVLLDVPPLSQQRHRGHSPQWDGGGASWCAPTSVAMVLRHWGLAPGPAELDWVEHPDDREVDHAARGTYDAAYGGCGNWAFGVAYAAACGAHARLTRLRSLAEAEPLLRDGIPLVASVRHAEGELTGAGYTSTGHLLVIVGLTADGDVVCNDPASHGLPDNARVRVTYRRAEFERAWLGGSGGLVYVIDGRPGRARAGAAYSRG